MSKDNNHKAEDRRSHWRKENEMSEEMSVFKSYLRRLLQDLKDLKEAVDKKEFEKASEMTDKLIEDTQKGIEDN